MMAAPGPSGMGAQVRTGDCSCRSHVAAVDAEAPPRVEKATEEQTTREPGSWAGQPAASVMTRIEARMG